MLQNNLQSIIFVIYDFYIDDDYKIACQFLRHQNFFILFLQITKNKMAHAILQLYFYKMDVIFSFFYTRNFNKNAQFSLFT